MIVNGRLKKKFFFFSITKLAKYFFAIILISTNPDLHKEFFFLSILPLWGKELFQMPVPLYLFFLAQFGVKYLLESSYYI